MIILERLNGESVYVNPDLIKFIEEKPDTTITFINSERLVVKNSSSEIISKIIEVKRSYQSPMNKSKKETEL